MGQISKNISVILRNSTSALQIDQTMAKRRRSAKKSTDGVEASEEHANGKLGPITTYEDVADSEDEFHTNRDKILLEDGPDDRRRRALEEEGMSTVQLHISH